MDTAFLAAADEKGTVDISKLNNVVLKLRAAISSALTTKRGSATDDVALLSYIPSELAVDVLTHIADAQSLLDGQLKPFRTVDKERADRRERITARLSDP